MIDRLQELILDNQLEAVLILFIGLIIGLLISNIIWASRTRKKDSTIKILETRVRSIKKLQQEKKVLDDQLKESKRTSHKLNQQVHEKDKSIELVKKKSVENERVLKKQLGDRDQNIRDLNKQINDKNESLDLLTQKAENIEANLSEIEQIAEERNLEISSLNKRMSVMQDDLTHIAGIGPKVSYILKSAGIDTFSKLSSSSVNKINNILESENPNLLRLIDPSSWPEQGKLASQEDWEALSAYQESIKGKRKKKA